MIAVILFAIIGTTINAVFWYWLIFAAFTLGSLVDLVLTLIEWRVK